MYYSMSATTRVARRAAADITAWLLRRPDTVALVNVEDDPIYQVADVDLLWSTARRTYRIEIKGDRLHQTGNFFLETTSNREQGTPGCFLYTEADFVFYYFVTPRLLYILPVRRTRAWFLAHLHEFAERSTRTPVAGGAYTTVGRVVPIAALVAGVPGVRRVQLAAPRGRARR